MIEGRWGLVAWAIVALLVVLAGVAIATQIGGSPEYSAWVRRPLSEARIGDALGVLFLYAIFRKAFA